MNGIERIIAAAAEHGRQSEPDHEVGDLQQAALRPPTEPD
jgi:hypothetical protein